MTVEELVNRIEARHRLLVSAFRAACDTSFEDDNQASRVTFGPKRTPNRPSNWDAIMEHAARLKVENVRWKEIKEQVEAAHGYRFDSDEALRKCVERWQKGRKSAG